MPVVPSFAIRLQPTPLRRPEAADAPIRPLLPVSRRG